MRSPKPYKPMSYRAAFWTRYNTYATMPNNPDNTSTGAGQSNGNEKIDAASFLAGPDESAPSRASGSHTEQSQAAQSAPQQERVHIGVNDQQPKQRSQHHNPYEKARKAISLQHAGIEDRKGFSLWSANRVVAVIQMLLSIGTIAVVVYMIYRQLAPIIRDVESLR